MRRGDVYNIRFDPVIGAEQGGYRPAIIIQNDLGNSSSNTTIVLPLSTKKPRIEHHIELSSIKTGLKKDSVVLPEQIRVIDKTRVGNYILSLDKEIMEKISRAVNNVLVLT